VDKKGYNYRMCCLNSLASVMPYITKDQVSKLILPLFEKACKDEIPNVKFCVSKIIYTARQHNYIDHNDYNTKLAGPLKEMANDPDKDVAYFAQQALQTPTQV